MQTKLKQQQIATKFLRKENLWQPLGTRILVPCARSYGTLGTNIGTVEKLFCTALCGHGKRDARNKKTLLKCGMWKNLKHGTSFDGSFFLFFSFLSSSVIKCKHAFVDGGGHVVHCGFF